MTLDESFADPQAELTDAQIELERLGTDSTAREALPTRVAQCGDGVCSFSENGVCSVDCG